MVEFCTCGGALWNIVLDLSYLPLSFLAIVLKSQHLTYGIHKLLLVTLIMKQHMYMHMSVTATYVHLLQYVY